MAVAGAPGKILEGVFAINKPAGLSSATVLRHLQSHFNPSRLFAPLLAHQQAVQAQQQQAISPRDKKRRRNKDGGRAAQVKLGHGGTLDPLATGVLVVGLGRGTKELQRFLECSKAYECVVLFGVATDTYDRLGKIVARDRTAEESVTKENVEEALDRFRGRIMQRPPVYSALRFEGKRFYEYAREGLEIPIEIPERPVNVLDLEMLEWWGPGEHDFKGPEEVAEKEERVVAKKVMQMNGDSSQTQKRKRQEPDAEANGDKLAVVDEPDPKRRRHSSEEPRSVITNSTAEDEAANTPNPAPSQPDTLHETYSTKPTTPPPPAHPPDDDDHPTPTTAETTPTSTSASPTAPPLRMPAARLRMTVTTGFYVRSLCHDLGAAVGSYGAMAELVRTRQGDFELGDNVLEYDDLEKGEPAWADRVEEMLDAWNEDADAIRTASHTRDGSASPPPEPRQPDPERKKSATPPPPPGEKEEEKEKKTIETESKSPPR